MTVETGAHYPLHLDSLPAGWRAGYVGDFTKEIEPGFASGEHNQTGTGVPHLRPMNVDRNGNIDLSVVKYVAAEKNHRRLEPGDVLFNNTNSPELVGKTAVVSQNGDFAFSNHMTRIRFGDDVLPRFGALQLHFLWMRGYFRYNCVKHVNQASISSRTLAGAVPFIWAPISAQEHIVAEIEKQFSRLDEAVANLKRVKVNLKRYKAAVLKAAIEGRLVTSEVELAKQSGRRVETGQKLLHRILESRHSAWVGRGKYKEPAPPRIDWQYPLPDGWVWTTLGHLAFSVRDGPHYSPKYADEGIPFISGGNVRSEGIDFSTAKFITPELHAELSKRCKPEFGDLLYTKGGTTGIARVNTEHREFNVWVHVAVLKLAPQVHPFYIQHALNSEHCYQQSQQYTHGVGNQDLGLTRMVWVTIPLPPRSEQDRIVAEVDRRLSVTTEVEAEIQKSFARTTALRAEVLSASFSDSA